MNKSYEMEMMIQQSNHLLWLKETVSSHIGTIIEKSPLNKDNKKEFLNFLIEFCKSKVEENE
jgi:hypothetical protein